jgi:hypothetical protein
MTAVNGIRSPTLAQAVEEIKGESGSLLTLEYVVACCVILVLVDYSFIYT